MRASSSSARLTAAASVGCLCGSTPMITDMDSSEVVLTGPRRALLLRVGRARSSSCHPAARPCGILFDRRPDQEPQPAGTSRVSSQGPPNATDQPQRLRRVSSRQLWDTGVHYGYELVPSGDDRTDHLRPRDAEERVIRRMRALRSRAHIYRRIADRLNADGVPTKRGGFGRRAPRRTAGAPARPRCQTGGSGSSTASRCSGSGRRLHRSGPWCASATPSTCCPRRRRSSPRRGPSDLPGQPSGLGSPLSHSDHQTALRGSISVAAGSSSFYSDEVRSATSRGSRRPP
jgi:hypothetical protein